MDDPNNLRYCDARYPFTTQFKLSGTYTLPYGFRVSGLFQSLPGVQSARDGGNVGKDISVMYSVGRAIAPGLTQTTVNLRLSEPGTVFLDRVNQLDFAFTRAFITGRVRIRPQVDIFNALNNNSSRSQHRFRAEPATTAERAQPAAGPLQRAYHFLRTQAGIKLSTVGVEAPARPLRGRAYRNM